MFGLSSKSTGDVFGERLKGLFWLMGTIIVFQGLIFLEEYYSAIGIRYYSLSIPIQDIVYKGVQLAISDLKLLALNFVLAGLFLQDFFMVEGGGRIGKLVALLVLVFLLGLTYLTAKESAIRVATQDLSSFYSELKTLREFSSSDKDKEKIVLGWMQRFRDNLRIINADENIIRLVVVEDIILNTKANNESTIPNLKIVRLGPNDTYESSGKGAQ